MARGSSSIWRSLRLVLLQIVGAVLLVYLAMEIWARVFPPKDKTIWPLVQNSEVGTTFRPNARVVLTNGLDFHVEERANEAGFLDRPLPPLQKSPGVCRIAIIGDSFVEAAQVPIRQKLQVELQRQLESHRPGTRVETMAFGFSGTGQLNQLGYLKTYVAPRAPDLVVLVFVSNDFANNSALLEAIRVGWHPEHAPRIFAREIPGRGIELQPIDPAWLSHRLPAARDERPWLHTRLHRISRFYRWLYAKLSLQYPGLAQWIGREPTEADRTAARIAALRKLAPSAIGLLDGWDPRTSASIDGMFAEPDPLPPAFEQAIRFTGFAFDTYKARVEALEAKLVVLGSHELQGRLERRLVDLLQPRRIPYVSLRSLIEKRGAKFTDAQWRHDAHWSPQGHKWAAEALLGTIVERGICSAAVPTGAGKQ